MSSSPQEDWGHHNVVTVGFANRANDSLYAREGERDGECVTSYGLPRPYWDDDDEVDPYDDDDDVVDDDEDDEDDDLDEEDDDADLDV